MLTELQNSVESEESTWSGKLSKVESELQRVESERDQLVKKNATLEDSLEVLKQAEEVKTTS